MEAVHDASRLRELQSLPLDRKIMITQTRIIEWDRHWKGNTYIQFSGGKDSTVLLDIARQVRPDIPAVFVNTGLEYPEIREFALSHDNVEEVRPRYGKEAPKFGKKPGDLVTFRDTVTNYGYPILTKMISNAIDESRRLPGGSRWKRMHGMYSRNDGKKSNFDYSKWLPVAELPFRISDKCCEVTKKNPSRQYQADTGRHPVLGTMAEESSTRRLAWIATGCNAFDGREPMSRPMSFWTNQDVLSYIRGRSLPVCSVYGSVAEKKNGKLECTGCRRTGCIYCAYGVHLHRRGGEDQRFLSLKKTHPRQYEYCMDGGEFIRNPDWDSTAADRWNPKEIWVPNSRGLGMAKVFDMCNELYGHGFMPY